MLVNSVARAAPSAAVVRPTAPMSAVAAPFVEPFPGLPSGGLLRPVSAPSTPVLPPVDTPRSLPQAQPRARVLQGPIGLGQANRTTDIRAAQRALRAWGFDVVVDGLYGPQTRAGLRRFVALVSDEPLPRPSDRITPGSNLAQQLFAGPGFPRPTGMPEFAGAVGAGGVNRRGDVRAVQRRLVELGYTVGSAGVDGLSGPATRRAIRTFVGAALGANRADEPVSTLEADGQLMHLLFSDAAPRWERMPTAGVGFQSFDRDGYGHGSTGAAAVIRRAGARYSQTNHPTPVIGFNDVSRLDGRSLVVNGRTEHITHRFGTDVDVRLPRSDGRHGTSISQSTYDREATYSVITAFAEDAAVERILFADRTLFARAESRGEPWANKLVYDASHTNHLHVDVRGALAGSVV